MEADLNRHDKDIARAVDNASGKGNNLITLSTGVVLKARQANPNILIRVMTAVPRPKPPLYFNEAMGRMMENPDHPDYVSQVSAWEMEYNNGMLNALIGLGTELVSVPKGMEGPHPKVKQKIACENCKTQNPSTGVSCKKCGELLPPPEEEKLAWLEEYAILGLPIVPLSAAWRYITWVMYIAAPTSDDTKLIGDKVKALSGVKEADVEAATTFPDGNKSDG